MDVHGAAPAKQSASSTNEIGQHPPPSVSFKQVLAQTLGDFEGNKKANPGSGFATTPIWLPDLDSNQEHRG